MTRYILLALLAALIAIAAAWEALRRVPAECRNYEVIR